MITAVVASKASISRKSFFSNPFTVNHFQFFPPLVVLPTVPLLPLTQTTLSFTTLIPRKLVLVPDVSNSTTGQCFCALSNRVMGSRNRPRLMIFLDRLVSSNLRRGIKLFLIYHWSF